MAFRAPAYDSTKKEKLINLVLRNPNSKVPKNGIRCAFANYETRLLGIDELEGYKGKYGDKRTWEAIAGTPDRLGLVKEYRDSEELKTIALQAGNRKARSQKYNILQFS